MSAGKSQQLQRVRCRMLAYFVEEHRARSLGDLALLRTVFDEIDGDKSGQLDEGEFNVFVRRIGVKVKSFQKWIQT